LPEPFVANATGASRGLLTLQLPAFGRRSFPRLARRRPAAEDDRQVRLPPPPWIAAHRGALPLLENTLPALLRAVEEGADLLEFDVQATADGVLVLHHDEHLGRLAGRPDLEVERTSFDVLAAVALRHPERPARGGRIPTLAELLAALPPGFPVNIELKVHRSARGRLAELALAATTGRENVLFSSFDVALLRELRRRSAGARIAPLARRWTPGMERLGEELAAWSLHVAGGVARANAVPESVEAMEGVAGPEGLEGAAGARRREPGVRVSGRPPLLVYTVNDAARARELLAEGAAGLFTDCPAPLRAELGKPGESGVLSVSYRGTRAPRSSV
jgi:glycerophosphoryl diester phosphodiesterase